MKRTDLIFGAVVLAVLCLLAGAASLTANAAYPLPAKPAPVQVRHPDWTSQAVRADTSLPLRQIPARITRSPAGVEHENPPVKHQFNPFLIDSVVQKLVGPFVMPTPAQNFDGINNQFGPIPPDTNGDVGRNHYVQIVNSGFQVFSKTGTSIYGPANNNTLFTGFGGPCETHNDGDPVAMYDAMADRWVLTWFTSSAPYMECIAVSASPDPTGSWYRYAFLDSNSSTTLGDYPKMTVWPDAYYMTTNEFGGTGGGELVYFHSADQGLTPTDLDSAGQLPPAGSPNYFLEWFNGSPGQLAEFKFHVDFTTPANSTFTGPLIISVANFNPGAVGIPQPGTTALLATLADRLMYRLAYRNMGTYESLVVNHTVNASGTDGVRWYELRDPNNAAGASVFQQGTYAPGDGVHRWMGSAAMDRMGDIAIGFSAGNATLFPSIRYAGRLVTDPAGQLSQGEATLFDGTGSEDYPAAPRWGDYSALQVDPADDCTFWFTTEYFSQTSLRAWRTRIGSFKFPSCVPSGPPTPVATPTGSTPTNTPIVPTTTPCAGNITYTGSITNTDGIQTGRLGLNDPKSSCAVTRPLPATSDSLARHYRTYTYTNSTASAQCVTVNITQNCGNNALQSVTYLGTFNPNSINTNFLAHGGASGHQLSYSFSLPAGQTAVVVALEVSPNLGCANYTLSINPCSTGLVTATPTSPATSPTATPIVTPSATSTTVCVGTTYQAFTGTGATMIPATNDINNHCDDCVTNVTLPFPATIYGTVYTSTNAGSNGLLNFGSTQGNAYQSNCLPVRSQNPQFTYTLFPYYDDLRTDITPTLHGIYTATIGTAPNRDFVLQWHTTYFANDSAEANFEVILHENSTSIRVIYGSTATIAEGASPASGIQLNLGQYTAYTCQTEIAAGTVVTYIPIGCGVTPTLTPAAVTSTPTRTATATACAITFSDVHTTDYFYSGVVWLYCRGAISGYSDNTFRPFNNTTRGQMVKIVTLAYGIATYIPPTPTFNDVPATDPFYTYIETAAHSNIVSGYNCGGVGEPCPGVYFRPVALVTRGQLSKIVVVAAGWALLDPVNATFVDVIRGSAFYTYIQTAYCHQVISGYDCGGPGEPCPGKYFRPGNNATRGQIAKIVYNAVSNLPCTTNGVK
jgi:hypothetical protein